MRKILIAVLMLTGAACPVLAEQGFGVQADMVGQGLTYRLMSAGGFGGEVVLRGLVKQYASDSFTYSVAGELRFVKQFAVRSDIRIYVGGAAGLWQKSMPYQDVSTDTMPVQTGLSLAGVVGLDWIMLELDDGKGISLVPELQFGYYNWPSNPWESTVDPRVFILPGVGIGLRYIF